MGLAKNNNEFLEELLLRSILAHEQTILFLRLIGEQIQKLPNSIATLQELQSRIEKLTCMTTDFISKVQQQVSGTKGKGEYWH